MPPTFAESTVFMKQISVSKSTLFAMIGPGGDKNTDMPVGRTRWDSWCPGCISQWNKSIGRPKKHHLVLNLLSTMKWKTIIISFLILAIFANFPASGISVTKALMARTIISADNFPASSLL